MRKQNPWPDISGLDGQSPYLWSLDGGGRHLIVDLIRDLNPKVFLEGGVFLGGSSLQWLANSTEDMILIAGDTWDIFVEEWIHSMIRNPAPWIVDMEPVRALEEPIKTHGIYKVALHNMRAYRHRIIPVKMPLEKLYGYVKQFVEPDIIYIDANKQHEDYLLAHEKFPNAIICGDDWEWRDDEGQFAVRPFVYEIAELRNCDVVVERATWILKPRS
jgi:hypothetical protein